MNQGRAYNGETRAYVRAEGQNSVSNLGDQNYDPPLNGF